MLTRYLGTIPGRWLMIALVCFSVFLPDISVSASEPYSHSVRVDDKPEPHGLFARMKKKYKRLSGGAKAALIIGVIAAAVLLGIGLAVISWNVIFASSARLGLALFVVGAFAIVFGGISLIRIIVRGKRRK